MKLEPVAPFGDSEDLRQSVIDVYRRLTELGFIVGTWGNISARLTEGLLVTPSRVSIEIMKPDDLVVVDWEGKKLRGEKLPSSEMHVHRLLLRARPDIGVFMHTHSPFASMVSSMGLSMPVLMEDMSQIIGGRVCCTKYKPAGPHMDLAEAAAETIGETACAVLLGNHGPVVGGRDVAEALVASQILEKNARTFVYTQLMKKGIAVPDPLVAEERHRFLYRYGSPADTPDA
jgi:L-ribulose-5-phosphate 4-epimerase